MNATLSASDAAGLQPVYPEPRKAGWRLTIDVLRSGHTDRQAGEMLSVLGMGRDRYDLRLPGGERLSRGVFDPACDPGVLAGLLRAASRSPAVRIHLNGRPMRPGTAWQAVSVLRCAAERRSCSAGSDADRTAFWGCPVIGIRLRGFTRQLFQAGERYWFSFFRREERHPDHFLLDVAGLRQSQTAADLCPRHAGASLSVLERLPASVFLGIRAESDRWRLTPSSMSHAGPLMPRHTDRYERWIGDRLAGRRQRP